MQQDQPDFLAVYLPHMDYCQQKVGPSQTKAMERELRVLAAFLKRLLTAAESCGYEVLVWGDYGISPDKSFSEPDFASEGFVFCGRVGGLTYRIFMTVRLSRWLIIRWHLYLHDPRELENVRQILPVPGISSGTASGLGLPPGESGDLVLEALPAAGLPILVGICV